MIKLIEKYPYDNSYDIIKTFSSKSEQQDYFNSFNYITFIDNHYVKVNNNTVRVPLSFDDITYNNINYIIINNGDKKYYGFIITKNWISEEVTEIIYEIDVIQTFMFDIKIKSSFIERLNCSIEEIADYDEGLEIGEHYEVKTMASINKDYDFFAMFGGIRQECITIDDNGNVTNVSQLSRSVPTPTTTLEGINYPLYFVPLKESYLEPNIHEVKPPSSTNNGTSGGTGAGDWTKGELSSKGFRFIKGMEGFAPYPYQDSGGYWTIAYGITKIGEADIYNKLASNTPVSEEEGAKISYKTKNDRYASKVSKLAKELGIDNQQKFDALTSLAYNSGFDFLYTQSDSMYKALREQPHDEDKIRPIWEKYKITSNGIQLNGLIALRKEQCNMFFGKNYEVRSILKINSNGGYSGTVTENNGNGWLP